MTNRCVEQDLDRPAGAAFEELRNHEIVKALVSDRSDRTENTRQVSPLTSGQPIWVLSRGHDHRGGTFFDEQERVVWLVAYRRHRSGSEDDFFPYCKELDRKDRLLPTAQDYERMVRDRDGRIVRSIVIEAPLILKQARQQGLIAMRIALDRHNVRCPLPAQRFLLNPVDHDLLGWERLWGLPVQPDARVATKRVRVACEGSADNVEEELEELLREAEGKGL